VALNLFGQYQLSNSLGLIDSLIAATALGENATLCTFNMKHYRVIPGLKLLQPYTR